MNPTEADPDYVARELQRLFYQEKRSQFKKRYTPAPRFTRHEFWLTAAEYCIGERADPYDFVRAAFQYCSVPGGPFPQMMASRASVRWYREMKQLMVNLPVFEGTTELEKETRFLFCYHFKQCTEYFQGMVKYFLDDSCDMPAYIRIMLCVHRADVWKKYGAAAQAELKASQHLIDVLRKINPNSVVVDQILNYVSR